MKKIYSVLSSIAVLFSLPALAAPLAEKSMEPNGKGKESTTNKTDTVTIAQGPRIDGSSPICRTGGGA
jgi:hypothetical protein